MQRRPRPDLAELKAAATALKGAKKPLIIAGGGVLYSQASAALAKIVEATGIPVCETQGGKSSLPDDHPLNMAAVGVTGTAAANRLAEEADVVTGCGHTAAGFHHRLVGALQADRQEDHRAQRAAFRCRQSIAR